MRTIAIAICLTAAACSAGPEDVPAQDGVVEAPAPVHVWTPDVRAPEDAGAPSMPEASAPAEVSAVEASAPVVIDAGPEAEAAACVRGLVGPEPPIPVMIGQSWTCPAGMAPPVSGCIFRGGGPVDPAFLYFICPADGG